MSKICTTCNIDKPLEDFNKCKAFNDGRAYMCRSCIKEYSEAVGKQKYAARRVEFPRRAWAMGSYQGHRKRGYEILFSREELEALADETNNCKICNVKLNWLPGKERTWPDSPTLDRIDSGKLMELRGIQILCHFCNRTKGERTMAEFIQYCACVVEDFG